MKEKILNVDDEKYNLKLLYEFLTSKGYYVINATNGKEAVEIAKRENPDLILMDIMMPVMDGIEATKILKRDHKTKDIPILIITAQAHIENKKRAVMAGADEFISKPIDLIELGLRIKNLLKLRDYLSLKINYQINLEKEVEKRIEELKKLLKENEVISLETIEKLGMAGEYRDDQTGKHVKRVGKFSKILAEGLGMNKEFVNMIEHASPLHDIGKIGIPDDILLKPSGLTEEEFDFMKKHTTIGAKILSGSINPILKMAQRIALTHHERWDGKGYPNGLKGEEIPIEGRIVSVADSFDAMTSKRYYKKAFSFDFAFNEIKNQSGRAYDPKVVEVFLDRFREIRELKEEMRDEA